MDYIPSMGKELSALNKKEKGEKICWGGGEESL